MEFITPLAEASEQQMFEVKKNECANALKEIKLLKVVGYMAGMLKDSLVKGSAR